jgi:hypothetical protein
MARYFNTFTQAYRDSDSELGYPYVLEGSEKVGAEGVTEIAAATADAILADVGDDGQKAQAALDAEQARDKPRTSLIAKLEKIVEAAEA